MLRIGKKKGGVLSVLGDIYLVNGQNGAKLNSRGDLKAEAVTEDPLLSKVSVLPNGVKGKEIWAGWMQTYKWEYESGKVKQITRQTVARLIETLPNSPKPVGEFSFCFGPAVQGDTTELQAKRRYTERIYAVYQAADGDYYMAKGNSTFTGWDSYERLVFVPSGAYNPSIAFDEQGYMAVAAEFNPAGAEIELWLYSYPYEGDAIRSIVVGEYARTPFLFLDPDLDLLYFYGNSTELKYRAKSEGYATDHLLPLTSEEHVQLETVRWFTQEDGFRRIISAYTLGNETKLRYIHTHGMRAELYTEIESAQAGLVGIAWELAVLEPLLAELVESESAQAGLVAITWEEVVTYNLSTSHSESEAAQAGLTAISWVEIFKVSDSFEESESAQAGLVSILWVKP
jgi:hypothetical protein